MKAQLVIPSIVSILILGTLGLSPDAFADPLTLFPTFVDSFSVVGQETAPQDVAFSSDGTKMFVVGIVGDAVNEYTLTTAFDVSTAAFVDSFSVAAQENFPSGVAFSSDGTKMFVVGLDGGAVYEYTLTTAFDVSTAAFVDSFSFAVQTFSPQDVAFSFDGTKMFVVDVSGSDVDEYILSTAFDVSTASFVDSFSVAGQETSPRGVAFSFDGTKMFVVGSVGDAVYEYTLTTAFDVSTASFVDSFSVAGQETVPNGVAFSSDGTKMFVVGAIGDDVNEYTLIDAFTLFPTFVDSFSVAAQETGPQGVVFSSDGTKMFVVGDAGDAVNEYTLTTPFDVSTAAFVDSFLVAGQEIFPTGVAFSSDGTKMFVVGTFGDAVYEYTLSTAFDVSTAEFEDSFSVAAQETSPQGVVFSSDGTKMFVVGDGDAVYEYTLTTPFDVSTAAFVDSFSVAGQETIPRGVAFSSDGTKMFVVGSVGDAVNEYTLTTPFDVSTAAFVDSFSVAAQEQSPRGVAFSSDGTKMFVVGSVGDAVYEYNIISIGTFPFTLFPTFVDSFSVAAQDPQPLGLAFSSDGAKMFVVGDAGDDINEYTLSTAFDVSTSSFVDSFSVAAQDTFPTDVAFSSDGTKMFVIGGAGDDINEYTLSTAFDVSTASFVDSFSVAAQETGPRGLAFSSNGAKMFVLGTNGKDVNEYTLTTPFDVSTASFVDSFSVAAQDVFPSDVTFSSDGAKMFVVGLSGDNISKYTLTTAFDVSTASFVDSFSVAAQETSPTGLAFSSDGTKMFVVGLGGRDVNEYTLNNAFTLLPAFVDSFSVAAQETGPTNVAFSSDGTKMFILGTTGNAVYEYTLTTAFDVSTAAFVDSFSVAAQDIVPLGIAFSSDGFKMFVVGFAGDDVNEYTLTTAFDVSTAAFVDSFSVAGQETAPSDVAFSSDGIKMFVVGQVGDDVNEYTLTTPFDVSTAAFVDSFSVAAQDTAPKGLAFSSDGFKMFVVGQVGIDIYEYTLTIPFDVSTAAFVDSFSVAAQDTSPQGVAFSSDGTKMFVVGFAGANVNEYNITSNDPAFVDLFTLFPTFVDSFSVAAQESTPQNVAFSSDGAKMFVVGTTGDAVHEYTLSTPFDVSTGIFVDSFSVAAQDTDPEGLAFSSDGTKMFVVGSVGDAVHEYTLSTGFDVSTGIFVDSFSVAAQDSQPRGVAFSPDGTKMFVVGTIGDAVYEYTLTTPFDVSTASFVDSFSVAAQETAPIDLAFSSDGTKMFVVGVTVNDVNEYTLTTPFDVSTASFVDSFSVGVQENSPRGVAFSSDGTKMFVVGAAGDDVSEYTLNNAFTLFPTFVDSFSVAAQDTFPSDLAFSSDGAKMFVLGAIGDDVNEYTLTTPFDVSTASFVDSFSVAAQDTAPIGLAFSSDGAKMFVLGTVGDDINEYTLTTPFDVSTASFVDSFSVAAQDTFPRGLAFSSDGTKMFVAGTSGFDINEYTLATGFDVSTASFVDSFSVAAQDTLPIDVTFSSVGGKMFVLGAIGDAVYEYTLTTPFDVSTASFVDSFSVAAQEISPQGLAFSSDGAKMFVAGATGDDVNEYSIVFIDTEKPVISPNGVSTSITFGSVYTELGATVTDNDPAYSETVTVGGDTVNTSVAGDYTITYNAPADASGNIPDEKSITITVLPIVPCSPPPSGNWVVDTSCTMTSGATINNGDLIVRNNSVLTVPFTLDIDFSSQKITVESGSGVLIIDGGTIT